MNRQASMTRRYRFSAGHRLYVKQFADDVNQKIFGKCNNPNGHGHDYTVLVTIRGEMDPVTGAVTDVSSLDRVVQEKIVGRFDRRHLNSDPAFHDVVPTGENLVRFIWDELVGLVRSGQLEKIGLIETRDNYFEYTGDYPQTVG